MGAGSEENTSLIMRDMRVGSKKKQKKTINKRRREILGRKSYCEYLKRSKEITILGGYLLLIT